jgi:hypothetical protein
MISALNICETAKLIADYFTKRLQGKISIKRDVIVNIDSDDKYHSNHRRVLGNDENYDVRIRSGHI